MVDLFSVPIEVMRMSRVRISLGIFYFLGVESGGSWRMGNGNCRFIQWNRADELVVGDSARGEFGRAKRMRWEVQKIL